MLPIDRLRIERHGENPLGLRLEFVNHNAGLTIPKLVWPGGCKARGVVKLSLLLSKNATNHLKHCNIICAVFHHAGDDTVPGG